VGVRLRLSGRGQWTPDVERRLEAQRLHWFQAVATLEVAAALERLITLAESTCEELADTEPYSGMKWDWPSQLTQIGC
jgi:hypothetical protein